MCGPRLCFEGERDVVDDLRQSARVARRRLDWLCHGSKAVWDPGGVPPAAQQRLAGDEPEKVVLGLDRGRGVPAVRGRRVLPVEHCCHPRDHGGGHLGRSRCCRARARLGVLCRRGANVDGLDCDVEAAVDVVFDGRERRFGGAAHGARRAVCVEREDAAVRVELGLGWRRPGGDDRADHDAGAERRDALDNAPAPAARVPVRRDLDEVGRARSASAPARGLCGPPRARPRPRVAVFWRVEPDRGLVCDDLAVGGVDDLRRKARGAPRNHDCRAALWPRVSHEDHHEAAAGVGFARQRRRFGALRLEPVPRKRRGRGAERREARRRRDAGVALDVVDRGRARHEHGVDGGVVREVRLEDAADVALLVGLEAAERPVLARPGAGRQPAGVGHKAHDGEVTVVPHPRALWRGFRRRLLHGRQCPRPAVLALPPGGLGRCGLGRRRRAPPLLGERCGKRDELWPAVLAAQQFRPGQVADVEGPVFPGQDVCQGGVVGVDGRVRLFAVVLWHGAPALGRLEPARRWR